jgi:hypothetical protein
MVTCNLLVGLLSALHHRSLIPPFQVRAVITTKSGRVGPFEQLTWHYDPVSTAGKACDTMLDDIVCDFPSQPETGGATGPCQEEQGPANGASVPTS